jgi:hypothetical protein
MGMTSLPADRLVLDAGGERGVCPGDSGGPALVLAPDGRVRVAGIGNRAVSHEECRAGVGYAVYTRVDRYSGWIEQHTAGPDRGPQMTRSDSCGPVSAMGRCSPMGAVWCADGEVQVEGCGDGSTCGWDPDQEGFRCIPEAQDPCGGYDAAGACEGNVARWCRNGELQVRDCGACGLTCRRDPSIDGVDCLPAE